MEPNLPTVYETPTPPRIPGVIELVAQPHIFQDVTVYAKMEEGLSLLEMLLKVQPDIYTLRHATVYINGHKIPKEYWHCVYPKPGTHVTMKIFPQGGGGGGKNPLRIVLMIAIMAAAIFLGPALGTALVGAQGITVAGATVSAAQIGGAIIMTVGMALVNIIAPIKPPKMSSRIADSRDSPTLFIEGARNQAKPFEPIPVVLGTHRFVPPYGARAYTEIVGDDQYLRILVIWGYGPLQIENIRIGESPIEGFEEVEIETRQGYPDDDPITIVPDSVIETDVSDILEDTDWHMRTSNIDADELSVDITFPSGLSRFDDQGNKQPHRVVVDVQYSPTGLNTWTHVTTFDLIGKQTNALRRGHRWKTPSRGQYDIRVRRNPATPNSTSDRIIDEVTWSVIRTITDEPPLNFEHPLAVSAIRIKATDQLNRIVDEINADLTSICKDWDTSTQTWIERTTNNPASLVRHVYQGPANAKRLADNRVDLDGLQEFHEFCGSKGLMFNKVIDYQTTVFEIASLVAAAGRASVSMNNNKWGVTIDKEQPVYAQMFTPRNSWGFQAEKVFLDPPHAWRIPFINEDMGYRPDERIVYNDGFTSANATRFEVLELEGQTDSEQIWKNGRFHLAQIKLRPERWTFNSTFEYILCRRGSRVAVQHDVLVVGLCSARIKALTIDESDNITHITVDEECVMEESKAYGIVLRKSDATVSAPSATAIVTNPNNKTVLELGTPVNVVGGPRVGDLLTFGEMGFEVVDGIVLTIEPQEEFTAQITCMPYSPGVYLADTGVIPDFQTGITIPAGLTVPVVTNIRSDDTVLVAIPGGGWASRILVRFQIPSIILQQERRIQARMRPMGVDSSWQLLGAQPAEAGEYSILEVTDGESYALQFRYLDANDKPGAWSVEHQHSVVGKSLPPPDVATFNVTQQPDGTRQYDMAYAGDPPRDHAGFKIKYKAGIGGSVDWDNDLEFLHDGLLTSSPFESNDLVAGEYTFAVKGYDTSGNESVNATYANVELGDPRLRNVIMARNEYQQGWPGTKTNCFIDSDGVLRATGGAWSTLAGVSWESLAGVPWSEVTARNNPISYETPVIDLGADISFVPLVRATGTGTVTLTMKTGTSADGSVTGAYGAVDRVINKRYMQFKVEADRVAGAEISALSIILDGEALGIEINDVDTSIETGYLDRQAAGHFYVADPSGRLTVITQATIMGLQGVGPGWSWELISKNQVIGSAPAAEFKVYNGSGVLADATIDVLLRGIKAS